ncbi:MAG: hypothetical protein FWD09_03215 [Lentimicrobiaceae bacterium]|nr:hypothetical protein [Lentimicrobiaceae bacterium]
MKKLSLLFIALCLILLGCQKEGIYNPDKKIKRIYVEMPNDVKRLSQEWTWDKNLLTKIDTYSSLWGLFATANFEYDNKERVIKVVTEIKDVSEYYSTISYNKGKYDRIEFYDEDSLYASYEFQYDKNKVSKIIYTWYGEIIMDLKKCSFISMIIPKEIIDKTYEDMQKSGSKGKYVATMKISYSGNNLSEIAYDTSTATHTYENYDNKSNPFYSFDPTTPQHLSKNNVGKITYTSGGYINTTKYEYTYNDNFPIEVVEKYSSIDDGSATIRRKTYYEYQ